jgi:hypothetical protein
MTTSTHARRLPRAAGAALAALAAIASTTILNPRPAQAELPPANCATTDHQLPRADGSNLVSGCFSLYISPARIVIRPSATRQDLTQAFTVVNNGNTDYPVTVKAIEFVQDLNGGLTEVQSGEAASWATISTPVVSTRGAFDKPGSHPPAGSVSVAKVQITIHPKPGATPGDHQIAIIFRKNADTGSNIRVAPQIGAQVLLQIPGKVTTGVRLDGGNLKGKHTLFGINQPGPANLNIHVANTGNVHHDFYLPQDISATISGFGAPKNTVLTFPKFTVLHQSTRSVTSAWDSSGNTSTTKPPLFCLCHAHVTANITDPAILNSLSNNPHLRWQRVAGATSYSVYRAAGGQLNVISTVPAGTLTFTDPNPITSGGSVVYSVLATTATATATVSYTVIPVVLIIIIAAALLVLVGGLIYWRRRRRTSALRRQERDEQIRRETRAEMHR